MQPQVGVCLVIYKGHKVLVGKRLSKKHQYLKYGFPGGKLEFGETFEECARRELKEECGTNLFIGSLSYHKCINCVYPEENLHFVTIFMVGEYKSGEPLVMEPDKCEKWEWYYPENIPNPAYYVKEFIGREVDLSF